ncbi:MAG: hypothetical protein ACLSFJ_00755 [Holdemania filiformis]
MIGFAIAAGDCGLFHQLGLEVGLYPRMRIPNPHSCVQFYPAAEWQFQQPWPVVINTAPAEVISEAMVAGWQTQPLIIDIACGRSASANAYTNARTRMSSRLRRCRG